jgi:TonB family protein
LLFVPFVVAWAQSDPTIPLRIRKPPATPVLVKGMPYSGEWQSDRTQVREDGTRIAETGIPRKEYRDSQGRTRRERSIPQDSREGVRIVMLDDPGAGVEYVLEPGKKIAHRFVLDGTPAFTPQTESLGVEVIRGLRAAGVRRTTTLPMGDLVVETWTAVDLQIMLREHTNDPLNGETNMRLTELRTDEPPAGLFQVPADYRTIDEPMDFTIASPMRSHTTAPEVISRVAAKYTDEARRAGVHGIVLLSATIDGRGRARDVEVERGLDPGLDQEAIKAVQQWRFKPGEQDGHPVRVNVHVEVTFSLLN